MASDTLTTTTAQVALHVAEHAGHHGPSPILVTMVAAIGGGVLLIWAAQKLKVPAIVLLLLGGILLGPNLLNIIQPASLGDGLRVIVSLAVGLILFEGGLTLDLSGYRTAPQMIRRLLTIGVAVTFLFTAIAIRLFFDYSWVFCFQAASLVIVTGPTVIAPLLKRIKINTNLHNILHWEGVLIDPLGVFVALLCYDLIVTLSGGGEMGISFLQAGGIFLLRIADGLILGALGGWLIGLSIKKQWVPEDMTNVFALGGAVLLFGLAEAIFEEAGLLAVTVAGFVLGVMQPVELKRIRAFKAEITDLMIGLLFMLLAARLQLDQFASFGIKGVLLVLLVMFVVRPLNIILSSAGLGMTRQEVTFLSWVAPRGIVAASLASFISLQLTRSGANFENPSFLETFTYSVIIATVILQGFTAGPLAGLLGLRRPAPTGWLVVGAHPLGRRAARFIQDVAKLPVIVVDSNPKAVKEAQGDGLTAVLADARDRNAIEERLEVTGIGNLLAATDNEDLNVLLCSRWEEVFGRQKLFRWSGPKGGDKDGAEDPDAPGRPIWTALPKPSLVSTEIMRGEATFVQTEKPLEHPGDMTIPLMAIQGKFLTLDHATLLAEPPAKVERARTEDMPSGKDVEEIRKIGPALYLRREADYLRRSLRAELVLRLEGDGAPKDLSELFELIVSRVVALEPRVDRQETVKQLIEREQSFPTALGHGVAVPHAYSPSLGGRVCAVAQIPAGMDFNAPDGQPVHIVFLLLSNPGDPEGHLATIAEIARLMVDKENRARLMDAREVGDVLEVVRRRGSGTITPRVGK
ncbi:MAG: cation:proton antiporter [Sumerlaeia bacterium]